MVLKHLYFTWPVHTSCQLGFSHGSCTNISVSYEISQISLILDCRQIIKSKCEKPPKSWLWKQKDHKEDLSFHPSFLSPVIDLPLAGEQWLGHFHQVVSALDNSFSSPLISPWLSFFTHQLGRCLMSLQVQHVLHPPLSLTSASMSLSFSLTRPLYSLSSCPFCLKLCANQPLTLSMWHFSLSGLQLKCFTLPYPLQIPDNNMICC